ncbi:MAG: zinc-dependent alcohol dehydrogenase family protein [Melioribacteraceae bacterium]|nr:zinc-dependent alcohol dehydrogenase family protein [Melioribacteraceae bacterium]MCF8354260.1 zinc-dependent alcohol dehydrogenase family protein [Melioribacteraceae bacterium]MCF8396257.1 zinc-dependent alcohol dehydrogenase family protein [Melioribacteraceae bacterium]MCF8419723.1 zinc-dependent alcohol dehydrogenase family protein [Melioribacteraceae bacterium]
MIAAVYNGSSFLNIEEYSLEKLKQGEVLIEVNYCGICGTDFHILNGNAHAEIPVILGHEYSGTVIDKANDVNNISAGDKVAIDPNIYCGYCRFCRKGLVQFCENHQALGVTLNGGFAEYSIVPSSQIYKLPENSDLSALAFAEPLSCCLRGIHQAEIQPGDSVVIIGGGSIGLMMMQLAKLSGASKIVVIEPVEFKRDMAKKYGADLTLSPVENNIKEIIDEFTHGGSDVAIECVGSSESVELAVNLVNKGGCVVIFGLAQSNEYVNLNLHELFRKEIKIHNSFLNPFTFERAVNLLITGKIDVSRLVSNQIPLKNINDIFKRDNRSNVIKSQLTNNKRRSYAEIN